MKSSSPVVVVGVGNISRGDDGLGICVARMVGDMIPSRAKIIEGIADGYALIETWTDSNKVFVIDCAVSGAEPGRIYRFDPLYEAIPSNVFSGHSTHSISIVQAIQLAKVLNRMPKSLVVFGIEGKDFSAGSGLSPQVERAASRVALSIVEELKSTGQVKL